MLEASEQIPSRQLTCKCAAESLLSSWKGALCTSTLGGWVKVLFGMQHSKSIHMLHREVSGQRGLPGHCWGLAAGGGGACQGTSRLCTRRGLTRSLRGRSGRPGRLCASYHININMCMTSLNVAWQVFRSYSELSMPRE